MAVVGEELGFAGVLLVIVLFVVLIQRGFDIGRQAIAMERTFAGLVAHGVEIWFGVQAFINMGVCLGLLPTKGLMLPLMSYGGSGLVMNLCGLALLLRVDIENRIMMRGGRVCARARSSSWPGARAGTSCRAWRWPTCCANAAGACSGWATPTRWRAARSR